MSLWVAIPIACLFFFVFQVLLLAFWIPRKKSFFVFATGGFSLLLAGVLMWVAISSSGWEVVLLVAASLGFASNSFFLFLLALEELSVEKQERLRAPISSREVERGLRWDEIEDWLAKK